MPDMLVNLTVLPALAPVIAEQEAKGVRIRKGKPEEREKISEWVSENINPNWAVGCEVTLEQEPTTCYIAVKETSNKNSKDLKPEAILGFACYDVVKKGVFGPTGIREDYQETGIDTALLLTCLHEMAVLDYGSATIGWSAFVEGNTKTNFSDNQ